MANPNPPPLTPVQRAWLNVVRDELAHRDYAELRLAAAVQHAYRVHRLSLRQIAEALGCSTKPPRRYNSVYVPAQVEADVFDLHSRDADRIHV